MTRSVCVVWILVAAAAGCGRGKMHLPVRHTAVTEDGWALSVRRYEPEKINPQRLPVVLCHGLSYNGVFWDLTPKVSLAQYLRDAGYDVWVPSLRGAGWSTKPPGSRLRQMFLRGNFTSAGGFFTSGGRGALKVNWTVDDHVNHDVPTLLRLVTEKTGAAKVHWIGHSMGGMVMAAHLGQHPDEARVDSFVAVAVPVFVLPPLSAPMAQLAKGRKALAISNAVISTNLPALMGLIAGKALATPIDTLFYNRANLTDDVVRLLSGAATEDISPGQLAQLIDMVSGGVFRSADGKVDYTAALGAARTPTLFCCGTVDNLATVGAVKKLHAAWGAAGKQFNLFGVVNGQRIDYGHDDLIIGRNARREVYPVIRRWLDSRGPKRGLLGLMKPASKPASRPAK